MKLAEIFGNNMVLQRERDICIFGYGKGKGSIEFCGNAVEFESETEEFRIYLPPQSAGGPYDMKVTLDGKTFVLKNILVGDVYLASGQSNMEFKLRETADIELKECDAVRFFNEPHDMDEAGNESHNYNGWQECKSKEPMELSAIGYYVAMDLHEHTNVPIGIISCNKGATRVDSWTAPGIVNSEEYQKMIEKRHIDYYNYKFNHGNWPHIAKLLSIVPYAINGVLWYQGESNRCPEEGIHYGKMLKLMIENWRELWDDNLSFYCVQLMPYEDTPDNDWGTIRKGQEWVSKNVDNVYMTTMFNTGETKLIHPIRKKEVAHALAKAVISTKYGTCMEYSGPVMENVEKIGNGVRISFAHDEGLTICGKYLEDTFVYTGDNTAYTVAANIEDNTLVLKWDPDIDAKRISMGFGNVPRHNLYNSAGYIASPFDILI